MVAASVKACSCQSNLATSLSDKAQGGTVLSGPVKPFFFFCFEALTMLACLKLDGIRVDVVLKTKGVITSSFTTAQNESYTMEV